MKRNSAVALCFCQMSALNQLCKICPGFDLKQMAEVFHYKHREHSQGPMKKMYSDLIFSLQQNFTFKKSYHAFKFHPKTIGV